MASSDSEAAIIRAVSRGYELSARISSLFHPAPKGDHRSEMAGLLSQELMQALEIALAIMKPRAMPNDVVTDEVSSCSRFPAHSADVSSATDQDGLNQRIKRIKNLNSTTTITAMPHVDGYQWRKYGEKNTSNTKFPRCYYRCTHKDDRGCPATKQVQQKDFNDPPNFLVTYNSQHTCQSRSLLLSPQLLMVADPPTETRNFLTFGLTGFKGIKQEQLDLFDSMPSKERSRYEEIENRRDEGCLSLNHSPSTDRTSSGDSTVVTGMPTSSLEDMGMDYDKLMDPVEFDGGFGLDDLEF